MLFQKILKPASAATGIQYVGATTGSGTTSGGTVTVSLTGLTGGSASSPSIGDIVVISIGVAGATNPPAAPTVTGYTQIATAGATDTNATTIYTGYKILTAADTSVAYSWTASNGSSTAYVSVWRNFDTAYPFDIAYAVNSRQSSILVDPPTTVPTTVGSYIVMAGAGASSANVQTYSSPDLSGFISVGVNNTYDSVIGGGYKYWTSGTFNPGEWTFSTTSSSTYSCASTSIVLRPTGKTDYPSFIAANYAASSIISVPSHNAGDWIVLLTGNANTTTIPNAPTGFTSIITYGNTATANNVAVRACYIVSDGTISSITTNGVINSLAIVRNATSINIATRINSTALATSTSITMTTASAVDPGSLLLFCPTPNQGLGSATGITYRYQLGAISTVPVVTSGTISGTVTYSSGASIYPCYCVLEVI